MKEGNKVGRKEGWKAGRKEGGKEGRKIKKWGKCNRDKMSVITEGNK